MNKAFTKEDDGDGPALVPPRAPLPPGTTNYVTQRGLQRLRAELGELDEQRAHLEASGEERVRALAPLAARRAALEERLASAEVVDVTKQPQDEVRFGASVTVRATNGALRSYQIVGVDEADPTQGRVAFVSPVARALLGRTVGDAVAVRTPRGIDELEIVSIVYEGP